MFKRCKSVKEIKVIEWCAKLNVRSFLFAVVGHKRCFKQKNIYISDQIFFSFRSMKIKNEQKEKKNRLVSFRKEREMKDKDGKRD